jgi:hypothetical protein
MFYKYMVSIVIKLFETEKIFLSAVINYLVVLLFFALLSASVTGLRLSNVFSCTD